MSQKSATLNPKPPADRVVRDIRRATRKHYAAEDKIRIVLEGLRGEESIAALCRREGIAESLYYTWSKEFLEAGKRRLAGDTARAATTDEVKELCLYFMGLNLSNRQIAAELGLNASDVQVMTEQLRNGLVAKARVVSLSGDVEIDDVYVVAGHKGQPAEVAKRGVRDDAASWQVRRAAARWRRTSRRSSV